jgi:hypothetical protein
MVALSYLFWRTPETRFALVVSLLLIYGFLALAPVVMLQTFLF